MHVIGNDNDKIFKMDILASNLTQHFRIQMILLVDLHCGLSPVFKMTFLLNYSGVFTKYNAIPFGNKEERELYWYCFCLLLIC